MSSILTPFLKKDNANLKLEVIKDLTFLMFSPFAC